MKKLSMILIIVFIISILSSCTIVEGNISDRISSPDNNSPPIQGKWIIDELLKSTFSQLNTDEANALIGGEALFHKDAVVIGDAYSNMPSFKIKKVDASNYLLYKYKTTPKILGIEEEKVDIITILNDNTYFYEFIRVNDDTILVNISDSFYRLKKTVEEVSVDEIQRYISVEKSMNRTFGAAEVENFQSGVLIGIKIPSFDVTNQVPIWEYKTIWINSQNKSIEGIYELNKLLMPRKNGFWIIENQRKVVGNSVNDELTAIPQFRIDDTASLEDELILFSNNDMMKREDISLANTEAEIILPSILKNILFLGNDYISIENIDIDRNSRRTLQIYAIDNLVDKKPIKLTDLLGDNGKEIFAEGARSVVSLDPLTILNEENVGLIRRNGYWTMKGRINYKQNEEELYKDFNIKAIPPKEMVSYDEQTIPWDAIRLIVPDVVDAYSSPNNEFIVVITSSHLVIYYLEDSDIVNNPVARIKLPFDSSIIMSEWALGRYANVWQNEVIKNGGNELEY